MPYDCVILLEPVNKNIATHIIDGDNWEAVSALWFDINCLSTEHEYDQFTFQEAQSIASATDLFFNDMCYMKDGKTYMNDGDNQIYSAKAARAMLSFLQRCNGFTVNCVSISVNLNVDLD